MTKDNRYSLATGTTRFLESKDNIENRISLQIYLEGNLPAELKSFQNALKDKTAILITQRANNLLGYDQIFVLEKGELIDSGTHDQLIEKEGFYRSIYEQQMNNQ